MILALNLIMVCGYAAAAWALVALYQHATRS